MSKPTIVLVHGAWADASSWNAVAAELHSQDFTVLSPPNLLRGVETDAAYISSFVAQRTTGPVVLVGSSMGGWVALHLALRRPDRIAAIVGIAAAPDFTEWGFPDHLKERLAAGETLRREFPDGGSQVTTSAFWSSGQTLRLLESQVAVDCPVRLIHGDRDDAVPPEIAFRLKDRLRSGDVQVTIIKGGGHRLSEPHEICTIQRTVGALLEPSK